MTLFAQATALNAKAQQLIGRTFEGKALTARVARGGFWLGAGAGADNALRMLRNILLARLLAPEAFGLMAIVIAFRMAFEAITSVGIKTAVIQNPRADSQEFLNGAWWFSFARGVSLYALAFFISPWIAGFYDKPELTPLLQVALLSIFFQATISPKAYVQLKKLNYRRWIMIDYGGAALGITTAIVLGFMLQNVWALVIGFTVESVSRTALSYIFAPFRPGFKFESQSLRELFKYARGMFGLGALTFVANKADVFVLGKVVDDAVLGAYMLALSLAQIPINLNSKVVLPLSMPAFSSLQDQPERLMAGFLKASKLLALLFLPLLTLMACASPFLLTLVYGSEYAVVSLAFSILCARVAVTVTGITLAQLYFATARPELNRTASLIRMVTVVALVYPFSLWWGAAGAALAALVAYTAWMLYNIARLRLVMDLPVTRYAGTLTTAVAASGGVAILWGGLILLI